jgi:HEAT repeat protein
VEAVEWTDLTSVAGFEAVVDRLANDPDASVRTAAAESLGDGDVGAVRPLLDALADPDSHVVLAVLESLEQVGDASILPELAPALEHSDPTVRERAAEVGEFLE